MIKAAASLLILISAALATSTININVSKSKFLFIKWANFAPTLHTVDGDAAKDISTTTASKWYVFANYYGKIQSGELGTAIQYKFNDEKEYVAAATNKDAKSTDDLVVFSSGIETASKCIHPDTAELIADRVELVETNFNVYVTIKCETKILSKLVDEVVEDVKEIVDKSKAPASKRDSQKDVPVVNAIKQAIVQKHALNASQEHLAGSKQALSESQKLLAGSKRQSVHESEKFRVVL